MNATQLLKSFSISATPARLKIIDILKQSPKPIDVTSIIRKLHDKKIAIDKVTVFRTINLFEKKEMVHKLEFGEGKYRYELSSLPHHHHAICTNCGKLSDIQNCDVEDLERKISHNLGFKLHSHRLEFFGLCENCQKTL